MIPRITIQKVGIGRRFPMMLLSSPLYMFTVNRSNFPCTEDQRTGTALFMQLSQGEFFKYVKTSCVTTELMKCGHYAHFS